MNNISDFGAPSLRDVTHIYDTVDTAERMGLPPDTLFKAMQFAAFPTASWDDIERVELGNGTALAVALHMLPGDRVLVSIIESRPYPFAMDGTLLHWSYVAEKLTGFHEKDLCDAVALTCFLGVALRRPIAVEGACDCPRHRGEDAE